MLPSIHSGSSPVEANTRRAFMKQVAWATAAGGLVSQWSSASKARANPTAPKEGRKLKYVGWQVGLTYQAIAPGGLDRDYLMRLLDEMAENKMNLLSLMMNSTASNDPIHDGYCWPVRSPKLKHYWDAASINGQPSTEFVREVITAAADRKIQIHFLMNGFWWTPEKIQKGYPSAECQVSRQQALQGSGSNAWWFCPDSPGAWQAGLDEVRDLLTFYEHPNVIGYAFEMLCYGDCFCKWTQEKYRQEAGGSMFDAEAAQLHRWRAKQIRNYLKLYADHKDSPVNGTSAPVFRLMSDS